jgi:uncharacterized protein
VENVEHSDFIVYLNKIPPEGLDLTFEIADPARAGIDLRVPVDGQIRARFDVQRLGGEIRVSGSVAAGLRLECSRCLAPFVLPVDAEVGVSFAPRSADLRGVIAEQIHLALPLKPLCSEDCRGICPRCGKEAAGDCGCAPAGADPRWEALKKLTVP